MLHTAFMPLAIVHPFLIKEQNIILLVTRHGCIARALAPARKDINNNCHQKNANQQGQVEVIFRKSTERSGMRE